MANRDLNLPWYTEEYLSDADAQPPFPGSAELDAGPGDQGPDETHKSPTRSDADNSPESEEEPCSHPREWTARMDSCRRAIQPVGSSEIFPLVMAIMENLRDKEAKATLIALAHLGLQQKWRKQPKESMVTSSEMLRPHRCPGYAEYPLLDRLYEFFCAVFVPEGCKVINRDTSLQDVENSNPHPGELYAGRGGLVAVEATVDIAARNEDKIHLMT
ncbi:hypothetical protein R1sor_016153 [Riccia sorocarpa]|uniref:Uncharacterized protein n=1 Tax=Riccia sorocarpa TaxID=122646 RepID=A0ABD3HI82_9MARC